MFILNGDTRIRYGAITIPVQNAVEMLYRDVRKVFAEGANLDCHGGKCTDAVTKCDVSRVKLGREKIG